MEPVIRAKVYRVLLVLALLIVTAGLIAGLIYLDYWNLLPKRSFSAEDFGIETIRSQVDYDKDGIDDFTDILLGAKAEAKKRPTYDNAYFAGGYPPDDIGVCTDMIWRALANAGYSLKDLVDADIDACEEAYPGTKGTPDSNIDFRRVNNLKVFFERNTLALTLDPNKIEEWQPGDIVTFKEGHIAIISDKRNRRGQAYILHNGRQPVKEEDALTRHTISGHFRFILGGTE
jgi:hypothetical protein